MSLTETYLKLLPFERSGRLYELVGIRYFYVWITSLAGAKVLPASRQPTPQPSNELARILDDTRYFELANQIRFWHYVPPIGYLIYLQVWWSVWFLAFLMVFHILCIFTERYKRALIGIHPGTLPSSEEPELELIPPKPHWWYTPKKWETTNFYKRIGSEWSRTRTLNYTMKTRVPSAEGRIKYIEKPTPPHLAKFERDTRIGEMLHWTAALLNLPPMAAFVTNQAYVGILMIGWILFMDVNLALLQRYHRVRTMIALKRGLRTA